MQYAKYYGYIIGTGGAEIHNATKEIQAAIVEATRALGYSKLRSN